jgi:osmotically-inducible protein OsmY
MACYVPDNFVNRLSCLSASTPTGADAVEQNVIKLKNGLCISLFTIPAANYDIEYCLSRCCYEQENSVMIFDRFLTRHNNAPADDKIKAEIMASLRSYAPLHATKPRLRVEVIDGAVTLSGVVRGGGQRGMAERLAASVEGVTAVHNHLLDDSKIEGVIAQALANNPATRISTTTVRIKSFNGVVTLMGPVFRQSQKMAAETVTENIPGVIKVVNRLVVVSNGKNH